MKIYIYTLATFVSLMFPSCHTTDDLVARNWVAVDTTYVIDGTEIYTTKYIFKGK